MAFGDGDWHDRLEAIFRKYDAQPGHVGHPPKQSTRRAKAAKTAPSVHFHVHIHQACAGRPETLAARAMARTD